MSDKCDVIPSNIGAYCRTHAREAAYCMVEFLRKELDEARKMREVFTKAANVVCSNICESTWRTNIGQVHEPLCLRLRKALATLKAGDSHEADCAIALNARHDCSCRKAGESA